jgi:hypothetical protein
MGASSHVAIFSHIAKDSNALYDASSITEPPTAASAARPSLADLEGEMQATKIAESLKQLLSKFDPSSFRHLITFWRATKVNLTLAEPLIDTCLRALDDLQSIDSERSGTSDSCLAYARSLLRNSSKPLNIHASIDLKSFCDQFLDSNTRLETIGLLFCAIIRAASEIFLFPPLYIDMCRRQELLSMAVKLTNIIVEVILSLDMLNDLQLMMQYENFISHSFVFGVQCLCSPTKPLVPSNVHMY